MLSRQETCAATSFHIVLNLCNGRIFLPNWVELYPVQGGVIVVQHPDIEYSCTEGKVVEQQVSNRASFLILGGYSYCHFDCT